MTGVPCAARRCILIAASGTGGHLFPALHIARAILKLDSSWQVCFVGSGRALEKQLLDGQGFVRHEVSLVGLRNRGIRGLAQFLFLFPRAFVLVWRLLTDLSPRIVIGVGGYASVLPVVLAKVRGIPAWIHEAELKPGLANWFLAHFATRISVAFRDAAVPCQAKVIYCGQPVRDGLAAIAQAAPGYDVPQKVLLLGGSQGAQALDLAAKELISFFKERRLLLWHQCRAENLHILAECYHDSGVLFRLEPFIDDIVAAYSWCDVIVSRAGAGTLMEIEVINRPAILVPYPFAQGKHQHANARVLERSGKAIIVEESADFTEELRKALGALIEPQRYSKMRQAPHEVRSLQAAEVIARGCLELVV